MSHPSMTMFEDGLIQRWSTEEWQGFNVYPTENPNPNPNFNFLAKKATTQRDKTIVSPRLSRSLVKEESFRVVLQPTISPPRDLAVPLPMPMTKPGKKLGSQETMFSPRKSRYLEKTIYKEEKEYFKCNAFCLSLPGFGKQKHVRSPKSGDSSIKKKMIKASSFSNPKVSLCASLENFECGSWASTATLGQNNPRLYFDLPVEMLNFGGRHHRDVQEPMISSSLFDKEREGLALRSVLKTRSSFSGRQHRSSAETSPQRRVRFSTITSVSCPNSPRSCITPRLLKARDDFNTFLAAQNS
ncbi:unnamed protein product [Cochlearia groenlandica]